MQNRSHTTYWLSLVVLVTLFLSLIPIASPSTIQAAPVDAAQEEIVVPKAETYWTMNWTTTNSRLYWADYCPGGAEFRFPGELKYKLLSTTYTKTLDTVGGSYCRDYLYLAADSTGIFYLDEDESNQVKWISASDPGLGPQTLYSNLPTNRIPTRDIEISGDYLLWATSTGIVRANKSGGQWSYIAADSEPIRDIVADATHVYWVSDKLYRVPINCSTLPCTGEVMGSIPGQINYNSMLLYDNIIYVVHTIQAFNGSEYEDVQRILYRRVDQASGMPSLYQVPFGPGWRIGRIASNGTYLFWFEYYTNPGLNYNARLRRMNLNTEAVDTVAVNLRSTASDNVRVASNYVYYQGDLDIRRIPINAAAISRDLVLERWEVTQAIQNTANDVPLIADKPTIVRAYGYHDVGLPVGAATVWLYGERNGSALPGSPLKPINGSKALDVNDPAYDRDQFNDSWNFELPRAWTAAGSIELRAVLDPLAVHNDSNPANNQLSRSFTFNEESPVCVRFYPVKTQAPKPTTYNNAAFWPMVELGEHLLPSRIDVYPQNGAWLEKGFWPFDEYYEPGVQWGDGGLIITHLWMIDQTSDDPDECDDANAETHYAGMVHPKTNTTDDGSTLNGQGRNPGDQLWDKIPDPNDVTETYFAGEPLYSWNNTSRISTLAHELGHNYGRDHIDCGGPSGTDDNYPYDPCQIAPNTPTSYYGLNMIEMEPIAPTQARDLMAYGSQRWISDYTWRAFYDEFDSPNLRSLATTQSAAQAELQGANEVVLVSGIIDTQSGQAVLQPASKLDTTTFSPSVQAKWLDSAQPRWNAELRGSGYHLRVFGANDQLLDDRALLLDHPGDGDLLIKPFFLTFPAPVGTVQRVELLSGTTVLDQFTVGPAVPTVSIEAPTGGTTVTDQLVIRWSGSDADSDDQLLYTVQYSPDAGATWMTLATQLAASELIIDDLAQLPGSTNAHIRVLASDGYHTGSATSAQFTLAAQAPQPFIAAPQAEQWFQPGAPIALRGGATDAEDGPLDQSRLTWRSGSNTIGYGKDVVLRGRYAPGQHTLELQATDSTTTTATVSSTFNVAPVQVPSFTEPVLDGVCDEPSYLAATRLPLPHGSFLTTSEGTILLGRSAEGLVICFENMTRINGFDGNPGYVVVSLDGDHSRDTQTQSDDYFVSLDHDGTYRLFQGTGTGYTRVNSLNGVQAEVAAKPDAGLWSGEIFIPHTLFNGWNHPLGLRFSYNSVGLGGMLSTSAWPISTWNNPATWATTLLEPAPQLTALSHTEATVGENPWTLTVFGNNFSAQSQVTWNGTVLPTTFINPTALTAAITAPQLANAGRVEISVTESDSNVGLPPLYLMVFNPTPTLTNITPASLAPGAADTTITLVGSEFVPGAQVMLGGQPLATTFVSSTELQALVPASAMIGMRNTTIVVANPEPVRELSNQLTFAVNGYRLYLPTVQR